MMKGVWFNEKHSFNDFNLVLTSKSISLPEPKTYSIEVPCSNGVLDLSTALTGGQIHYDNRDITINLTLLKSRGVSEEETRIRLSNFLHGKVMRVRFESDPNWYYKGRCTISSFDVQKGIASIVIKVEAEPYKYDILTSLERKQWVDPVTGEVVVRNLHNFATTANEVVTIPKQYMPVVPKITVNNSVDISFKTKMYSLTSGANIIPDIVLTETDRQITFKSAVTASIEFTGGAL